MSTRLDLTLQRFPEHEEGIRLLAARDPSGNLKYLDWSARMLAAKQALAGEVADVVDLFHQFSRQQPSARRHRSRDLAIRPDLYSYRPQDLASLRDTLLKVKRAFDKKRRERERLYRIEGEVEADVVYDSPDLVVRHIKNKQASAHYGLSTKWCIAMTREEFFEEYEAHNATFFFFERKAKVGDEFDKVAVMLPRNGGGRDVTAEAFTSVDRRTDMMGLARVYGSRVFDIFRDIHERSERYPGSDTFCVYAGVASREQLEAVFTSVASGSMRAMGPYEMGSLLEAICCNDAAPPTLLEEVMRRVADLLVSGWKRWAKRGRYRRVQGHLEKRVKELTRTLMAALAIHPQTPDSLREKLVKDLRRRHVDIDKIHRVSAHGQIGVQFQEPRRVSYRRSRRLRARTVSGLRYQADRYERLAKTLRKRAMALKTKLAAAAKKRKKRGG